MVSLAFLLAALAADPATTSSQDRPYHEIQREISDLLKREATSKNAEARAAIIKAMCDLHRQIVHDPRYSTSDVLKEYRTRLWSRLTKVKAEIKQHLARDGRANQEILNELAALESADPAALAAADSLASSFSLLSQTTASPVALLGYGGAPYPPDDGPSLVALIERTINPNFWDTVGGPGSIIYYRPLQCLVVRATGEVHGNLGGLLGGIRDAGK